MTLTDDIVLPQGFRAAGMHAGIKPQALDLGLLVADRAGPAAAVFTTNSLLGAHVGVCRDHLQRSRGRVRAVVVNSGNANCATGSRGIEDAIAVATAVAECIGCAREEVLPISTGVIGAPLPLDKILDAVPALCANARADCGVDFARAIMTTDTCPKHTTAALAGDGDGRVVGIAKGSGMIHPDLATMLGFVLADRTPMSSLHRILARVVDRSFHRLSVDGDTSPNDTVLFWSGSEASTTDEAFESATLEVSRALSRQIAADGEGASRLITIRVSGASDERAATRVGRVIATSMLTKTAVTGRDPNWGRILSAAGRAATFDPAGARVSIGGVEVFALGQPYPDREAAAAAHLRDQTEVTLGVDLGLGHATAEVWTCDLTSDYVLINADYRT